MYGRGEPRPCGAALVKTKKGEADLRVFIQRTVLGNGTSVTSELGLKEGGKPNGGGRPEIVGQKGNINGEEGRGFMKQAKETGVGDASEDRVGWRKVLCQRRKLSKTKEIVQRANV